LSPNILLSILYSNTLSLSPSITLRDQASHPHKTAAKIRVLYIPFLALLHSEWDDEAFWTEREQASPKL
jgi:hypothetical protein